MLVERLLNKQNSRRFMNWYKITSPETHCPKKKKKHKKADQVIYIWGDSIKQVLEKYRKIPGVQRNKIPEIRPLDSSKISLLEKSIVNDKNRTINSAKRKYVKYATNENLIAPV